MKTEPTLAPRKMPRQARSRQMRQDILEASIRVLRDDGPLRFTTQRVARVAGISVGSLYQYFPNKEALVFAVRSQMIERGLLEAQRILDDAASSPRVRIHRLATMYFLAAARDSVEMGAALHSLDVYFPREAQRAMGRHALARFADFLLHAPGDRPREPADVEFGADLLVTALQSIGRSLADRRLSRSALERWATACADMLCDYLCFA